MKKAIFYLEIAPVIDTIERQFETGRVDEAQLSVLERVLPTLVTA